MRFISGIFLGMWVGILLCAVYLHTKYFPEQYDYQRALSRCDADKDRVGAEVRKISMFLKGIAQ